MNTYIKEIEISNFKSIRHQKIDGCKRINVFIGYPNVGKSNILEALGLGCYISAGEPRIDKIVRVDDISELFFDRNINEPFGVLMNGDFGERLTFNFDNEGLRLHIQSSAVYDRLEFESSSPKDRKTIQLRVGIDQQNTKADSRMQILELKPLFVRKYDFERLAKTEDSGGNILKFPTGENLYYVLANNAMLRNDLKELFARYQLKVQFAPGVKYSMQVVKTLGDETVVLIPFHQIADTLQRLIFYKAAIHTNESSVLIFEEPEAHMFPPYIRKFTSDVVFDKTNQFFIATHSPYVLDEFIEEAPEDLAIYLVDYKDGETTVKNLSKKNLEEIRAYGVDLFFNLESYLKNG